MLFSSDYSMKMPLSEAMAVSIIGIITVILILAIIACLIIFVSKVIRSIEAKANNKADVPAPAVAPIPEGMLQGEVELINTDEKTAAVIMAIVSDKSGLPLNKLSFKSIKLIDEEKKGDKSE